MSLSSTTNFMNTTSTPEELKAFYQAFLKSIVKDALEAAREQELAPEVALEHILECIGEDASIELEEALASNTEASV